MFARIFILIVILLQQMVIGSMSVSGKISEDITFLHKPFPVPPSMRAIIQVDVTYAISSVRRQGIDPVMGIYTTKEHVNIQKQCVHIRYGQLKNSFLHRPIRLDNNNNNRLFLSFVFTIFRGFFVLCRIITI